MDKIFSYIFYMLPFMLISLIIYIPIRFCVRKKNEKSISLKHEILLGVFIVYICGLLSLTVLPRVSVNEGIHLSIGQGTINLVPLRTIMLLLKESFINFAILFIGNIVMFMPIGLFIPLLWKKRALYTVICGLFFSIFIELSQVLIGRNTDVDDIILNTLGVYLGYLFYLSIFNKLINSST